MSNNTIAGLHVSALQPLDAIGAGGTNDGCHGNTDGVDPNLRAILAHARVLVVCWGSFYENVDAFSNAFQLCKDLVTGPYVNGLAQYGVGRGTMKGQGRIADPNPPATLNEDEARDRITAFVSSFSPEEQPAVNEESLLYVLFLPPQTKPTISSGKDDFCGYHKSTQFNPLSRNDDLFYAVIRTDKADQSSGQAFIQSVSYCVSHEIAEAMTSRDGFGYHKGACEIGDLCEQTGTHNYRGWQVEQYWSQWDRACVNGENPVSVKKFLRAANLPRSLRALRTPKVNIEFIASIFR